MGKERSLKMAMACAGILAFVAMPAHAADERAASAGPVIASASPARPAMNVALPSAGPALSSVNVTPPATNAAPLSASPAAPEPAVSAAAPVLLPPAPSALITLKSRPAPPHRFLDATNTFAFGTLAVGLTADALSTQKGLSYPGFYEVNPVARPFMKSRAGAAVYSAGSFGLLAGGAYLAHRTKRHKLERLVPFAAAGWEGLLSFHNYRVIAQHTR